MIRILDAIIAIDPHAQVTVRGEDVNRIEWADGNSNGITVEQIQAKQAELQDAYDNDYSRKRKPEYPDIGDQLDALLKHLNYRRTQGDELVQDLDNIIASWLSVKSKYPKS